MRLLYFLDSKGFCHLINYLNLQNIRLPKAMREKNELVYLEPENILDINEKIRQKSLLRRDIEYGGYEDYPIRMDKLESLVKKVPGTEDLNEVAAYYLKNIILLQPFADANHRTAFLCVDFFLRRNGLGLDYRIDEAVEFQKAFYSLRFRLYGTYDDHGISVLEEENNEAYQFCLDFIKEHLTEGN